MGLCEELEGGVGDAREAQEGGGIRYLELSHIVQQKIVQHCKGISLQLKMKIKKEGPTQLT